MLERPLENPAHFIISAAPPSTDTTRGSHNSRHARSRISQIAPLDWLHSTVHSDSGDLRGNVFRGFRVLWNPSYRTLCLYLLRRQHSRVWLMFHHFLQWSSHSSRAPVWRQDEDYNKMTTERMNLITSTTSPLTPRKQSYFTLHECPSRLDPMRGFHLFRTTRLKLLRYFSRPWLWTARVCSHPSLSWRVWLWDTRCSCIQKYHTSTLESSVILIS